jgi:hypothetical protein
LFKAFLSAATAVIRSEPSLPVIVRHTPLLRAKPAHKRTATTQQYAYTCSRIDARTHVVHLPEDERRDNAHAKYSYSIYETIMVNPLIVCAINAFGARYLIH